MNLFFEMTIVETNLVQDILGGCIKGNIESVILTLTNGAMLTFGSKQGIGVEDRVFVNVIARDEDRNSGRGDAEEDIISDERILR